MFWLAAGTKVLPLSLLAFSEKKIEGETYEMLDPIYRRRCSCYGFLFIGYGVARPWAGSRLAPGRTMVARTVRPGHCALTGTCYLPTACTCRSGSAGAGLGGEKTSLQVLLPGIAGILSTSTAVS